VIVSGNKIKKAGSTKVDRTYDRDLQKQKLLALFAAECAEHVLPIFEGAQLGDDRPRKAIKAARAWVRNEIKCGAARSTAFAAHAAAREVSEGPARAAARAAGHAAATAHMAAHARAAAAYAVKAVANPAEEITWQRQRLPKGLETLFPDKRKS
jgi:hypothetical protein